MNKAITITQEIKDKNPDFRNFGLGIKVFTNSNFPKRFNGVENVSGYYETKTHLHEQDGFWEVERLPLSENQKYGTIERKGTENKYHYPVIDLTQEEIDIKQQEAIDNMPTLASVYASEIGHGFSRDIDVQIDQVEVFKPKEKVYHLLGYPLYKEYYKDDVCVCRLEYSKIFEDRTHEDITKNEFVGTKTKFIFYKDESRELFVTKEKITKYFSLVPTTTLNENNEVIDVVWSSADREGLLRQERYKSEQVMKAFNPNLYALFIMLWQDLYMTYKETGRNTELIQAISTHTLPKLDEQVLDEDKAVVFSGMGINPPYPSLTIRELIISALP